MLIIVCEPCLCDMGHIMQMVQALPCTVSFLLNYEFHW